MYMNDCNYTYIVFSVDKMLCKVSIFFKYIVLGNNYENCFLYISYELIIVTLFHQIYFYY